MKIKIICVGKIKEKFLKDALSEYLKRLSRYIKLEICEVNDEKAPEKLKKSQEEEVKKIEGERILKHINNGFTVCLSIDGKNMSSEEFSDFIKNKMLESSECIYFVIGGSLGLSQHVLKKADMLLSFSKMTFTHQLMRVILLEQIYRGFKIINNEPYHK